MVRPRGIDAKPQRGPRQWRGPSAPGRESRSNVHGSVAIGWRRVVVRINDFARSADVTPPSMYSGRRRLVASLPVTGNDHLVPTQQFAASPWIGSEITAELCRGRRGRRKVLRSNSDSRRTTRPPASALDDGDRARRASRRGPFSLIKQPRRLDRLRGRRNEVIHQLGFARSSFRIHLTKFMPSAAASSSVRHSRSRRVSRWSPSRPSVTFFEIGAAVGPRRLLRHHRSPYTARTVGAFRRQRSATCHGDCQTNRRSARSQRTVDGWQPAASAGVERRRLVGLSSSTPLTDVEQNSR